MNNTVCPCGGFHEFEPVKGEQDFVAGIVAGACSTCLFCLWWPLLLCGAWQRPTALRVHALRLAVPPPARRHAVSPNCLKPAAPTAPAAPAPGLRRLGGAALRADARPRRARAQRRRATSAAAKSQRMSPTSSAPSARCWWTARCAPPALQRRDAAGEWAAVALRGGGRALRWAHGAQGHLKAAPTVVPEKNPVSGQPNAFYGWSTPAQTAAKAENASHEE